MIAAARSNAISAEPSGGAPAFLEIENLGKRFGGFVALENITYNLAVKGSTACKRINARVWVWREAFNCRGRS